MPGYNIECSQHLQRDLQQITDDNPSGHEWASKLKALISAMIHLRNQRIALGFSEFSASEVQYFKDDADRFLDEGRKENEAEIRKAKVSGQFDSELTAQYYAVVKTYTETCRRNGINEMEALSRLCAGNPYTVKEIIQNRTAVSSPPRIIM